MKRKKEQPKKIEKKSNSKMISSVQIEEAGEYLLKVNNSSNILFLKRGQTIELWKK